MPTFRPRLFSLLPTLGALVFLWLPPLLLFGAAVLAALKNPSLLHTLFLSTEYSRADSTARTLFLNTVALAVSTSFLSVLFGVPCGIAMARAPRFPRALITLLCALPMALPPLIVATVWLAIFRLAPARMQASLALSQSFSVSPVFVAAPLLALCFYPVVAFAVRAALLSVASEWEDAARSHGNLFSMWRGVLFPLLRPAIYGAAGLVAALAMWEMAAPDLVDARTYAVQIYLSLNDADALDAGGKAVKAALASLPLMALGALSLWPAVKARNFYSSAARDTAGAPSEYSADGKIAAWLSLPVVLASPLALIGGLLFQLGSPHIFAQQLEANRDDIYNTIFSPMLATLLMLTVAFTLIVLWSEWNKKLRVLMVWLAALPMLVAPVVLGLALIGFWNRDVFAPIYGGIAPFGIAPLDAFFDGMVRHAMTIIGYGARFLPAAILLIYAAWSRLDPSLSEAARGLGASTQEVARRIFLPLLAPALLGIFALLWALCAGELATTILVYQPGGQTLPLPIFNLMHIGATREVAALSLALFALMLAVITALLLAWQLLTKQRKTRRSR